MKQTLVAATIALSFLAACGGEEGVEEEAVPTDLPPATDVAEPASAGGATAEAALLDANGQQVGTVTLTEAGTGVQLAVRVEGLPAGTHGIHIHETGTCTPPDFTSAGGHFNPTAQQHGLENPQGPHAGDLQNLEVGQDGTGTATLTNERVTIAAGASSLMDADGSAVVVHATADDQTTDPSGNSGARIACGTITAP
jgi:superoxide dismutase, Cu-Zn family